MPTGKCTQRVFCRPFFFLLQLHSKANCKEETFAAAATTPPTSFSIFILYQMHFLLLLCQRTNEATSGADLAATFAPWQTKLIFKYIHSLQYLNSVIYWNVLSYFGLFYFFWLGWDLGCSFWVGYGWEKIASASFGWFRFLLGLGSFRLVSIILAMFRLFRSVLSWFMLIKVMFRLIKLYKPNCISWF